MPYQTPISAGWLATGAINITVRLSLTVATFGVARMVVVVVIEPVFDRAESISIENDICFDIGLAILFCHIYRIP